MIIEKTSTHRQYRVYLVDLDNIRNENLYLNYIFLFEISYLDHLFDHQYLVHLVHYSRKMLETISCTVFEHQTLLLPFQTAWSWKTISTREARFT